MERKEGEGVKRRQREKGDNRTGLLEGGVVLEEGDGGYGVRRLSD